MIFVGVLNIQNHHHVRVIIMVKIVHAQTVLQESTLEELKAKSGEPATKDAIAMAVAHYLSCQYTEQDSLEMKLDDIIKKKKGHVLNK